MWNISGVKNVFETWEFLSKNDIIMTIETWLEGKNEDEVLRKLRKDYLWGTKAAVRVRGKGRAMGVGGGLLVGIKKYRSKEITIVEWEYGLIIKGVKQISNDKVNIVAVYNNAKIGECLSRISALLDTEDMRGTDTILVGDFNARIGTAKENDEATDRSSDEKECNPEGKKLLNFCNLNAYEIRNGRVQGDWNGNTGERAQY